MNTAWRGFPLHPEVPAEGLQLARLFNRTEQEIEGWAAGFRQKASELGLPFGRWRNIYNSRLAQEVGLWASEKDKGGRFHKAAFQAYLVDGKNIASKDVLLNLVESVGLPSEEASEVIEKRTYRDQIDQEWTMARKLGITAVPTLVLEGRQLVGAQPYEELVRFINNGNTPQ